MYFVILSLPAERHVPNGKLLMMLITRNMKIENNHLLLQLKKYCPDLSLKCFEGHEKNKELQSLCRENARNVY